MNTITTEQPVQNQSFFKLPLIFITVFFIIYFISIHSINIFMQDLPIDLLLPNIIYSLCSELLSLFLFFVTAVFCCQKYKLHSVTDSWLTVSLIAIIFALLCIGWSVLFLMSYSFMIFQLFEGIIVADILLWITNYPFFMEIIFCIIFIFILMFLFYLFAKKDTLQRTMFKLQDVSGSRVHSHIYCLMMLFSSIVAISFSLSSLIDEALNLDDSDMDMMMVVFLLIVLISFSIYYMTCYFATRNHFKRIEPTVKLGRLILTVLVTYLFLFSASFSIIGIILLFAGQYMIMMAYYMNANSILMLVLVAFVVYSLINLLLVFVFSRLAVKIMYS